MKPRLLLILTVALLFAVPDARANDEEKIQGTWNVVSVEDGGRKAPEEEFKNARMIITKDKITLVRGEDKKEDVTFKLDPTKKPKWIDITVKGEKISKGIYELDGDSLKICFNEKSGGERAKAFVSEANSPNDVLIVLKRQKP